MDHERAISGHELTRSRGRIGAQGGIERKHPVVDRGVHGFAELDDESGFPRVQKAWISLQCHAAIGLNGFRVTPACSNRARTRLAVATAWSESP